MTKPWWDWLPLAVAVPLFIYANYLIHSAKRTLREAWEMQTQAERVISDFVRAVERPERQQ